MVNINIYIANQIVLQLSIWINLKVIHKRYHYFLSYCKQLYITYKNSSVSIHDKWKIERIVSNRWIIAKISIIINISSLISNNFQLHHNFTNIWNILKNQMQYHQTIIMKSMYFKRKYGWRFVTYWVRSLINFLFYPIK